MFSMFFSGLFKRNPKVKPQANIRQPLPKEYWTLDNQSDPFPSKFPPVLILDVKDGWVRYRINSCFNDERMDMDTFIAVYRPTSGPYVTTNNDKNSILSTAV